MAVQLFVRKDSGDSEWTSEANKVCLDFSHYVRSFLSDVEFQFDEAVDLRDFQTVLKGAIDDVIHHELVCRRLGTKPKSIEAEKANPEDIGGLPIINE